MYKNVIEFIGMLRTTGLQISTAETLDCLHALALSKWHDKDKKEIMAATLVKRATDRPVFEKVYAMYYGYDPHPDENEPSSGEGTSGDKQADFENAQEKEQENTNSQNPKQQKTDNNKNLFNNILEKNYDILANMVNSAVDSLGELKQSDAENFSSLVRRSQIALDWFMAENKLERAYWTMPYEEWLEAKEQFDDLKEKISEAIRKKIEQQLGKAGQEAVLKQLDWKHKDFGELRDEEIAEMERRVMLLGKRLAHKMGRRNKTGKKGIIDARRLLKKAAGSAQMIPAEFYYLIKKPAKPKLAVMCDISGSVTKYSRFMLQIVYIFANRFPHIKAYVFVDGIVEITDILRASDWKTAFDNVFRSAKCSETGYSDYGKVFTRFNRQYLDDVDNKTGLVILGDARTNWFPTGIDEFILLSKKAKTVLWLNPQHKGLWDQDDSVIGSYGKYCRSVEECRNLAQLEAAAKKILVW